MPCFFKCSIKRLPIGAPGTRPSQFHLRHSSHTSISHTTTGIARRFAVKGSSHSKHLGSVNYSLHPAVIAASPERQIGIGLPSGARPTYGTNGPVATVRLTLPLAGIGRAAPLSSTVKAVCRRKEAYVFRDP